MRSILLFITTVIALSGCTPPAFVQERNNVKQVAAPSQIVPDKTEKKDYDSTLSDCEFEASQNPDYDNGLMGRLKAKNYIKGCLSSKGWILQ